MGPRPTHFRRLRNLALVALIAATVGCESFREPDPGPYGWNDYEPGKVREGSQRQYEASQGRK